MNEFFTQFKNIARSIRLSHDEREVMRVQLHTYFENNPVGSFAAPKPTAYKPVPSTFYFFSARYMVPVALLLVVVLGSGSAFAAEGALPGDALYAMKINVNEKVQTALATTPEAKAQVQADLATTRLEEAETLAQSGRLDATTTALLASNFVEHAKAAQAQTLNIESHDPGAAAQLDAQFNGSLSAHGAILAQIGDDSSDIETTHNSNSLAMRVQEEEGGDAGDSGNPVAIATLAASDTVPVAGAPIRTSAALAPQAKTMAMVATDSATSTSAPVALANQSKNKINAPMLGAQASTSIAAILRDFAALKASLDVNTSANIAAQIAAIQTSYASQDFISAIRASAKLDAYLKAGKKFNLNLMLLTGTPGNANSGSGGSNTSDTQGGNDSGKGRDEGGSVNGNANVQLHL